MITLSSSVWIAPLECSLSRQQCQDDSAVNTTGRASTWQYAHPDWSRSQLRKKPVTETQNSQTNDNMLDLLEAHAKFSVRFLAQSTFIFTAIPESLAGDLYTDHTQIQVQKSGSDAWEPGGNPTHCSPGVALLSFSVCQLERRQRLLFMVGVGSVKWWAQQTHTKQNLRAVPVSTAEFWLVGVSHKRNYYVQKIRVKGNIDRKGRDREDTKDRASRDHWKKCQNGQSLRPKRFSAAVP